MGMFDYVKFSMKCPKCGKKVNGFQSKDGECTLNEVEYWKVRNFYSNCDNCNTWIEFNLKNEKIPISKYKMKCFKNK